MLEVIITLIALTDVFDIKEFLKLEPIDYLKVKSVDHQYCLK